MTDSTLLWYLKNTYKRVIHLFDYKKYDYVQYLKLHAVQPFKFKIRILDVNLKIFMGT